MPDGTDQYGAYAEYLIKGKHSSNTYKVQISLLPARWTLNAETGFPKDRCAQLIRTCNCMDSGYRGPLCKHAAACLLVEHRSVNKNCMLAESQQVGAVPTSSKGKWLTTIFGALQQRRLLDDKKWANTVLALPAPPPLKLDAVTQTMTQSVQTAAPSGAAPVDSIVRCPFHARNF